MNSAPPTQDVFLRKASGLVKSAGPFDVFIFNFGLISVGIAVTLAHSSVPSNYPGASLPLAELLAGIMMACIAFGFWCWSVAIPRSGGIYTFLSRGLSPGLGFSLSFVDTFTWLFYNALAATYLTTIGISPACFVVGYLTDAPALTRVAVAIQAPAAQLAIGTVAILLASAALIAGQRVFYTLQKVLFLAAIVGTVATIVALAGTNHETLLRNFDGAMKVGLPAPLDAVRAASPDSIPSGVVWTATGLAIVWPILSFVGSIFSVNIGGEVRNFRRTQLIGIFGSLAAAAGLMALLSYLGDGVFGRDFQVSLGAYSANEANPPLPVPPYFSLLAALASNSPTLAVLICLGFFAWAFFWIPATMMYATRAVIAWSFDRVAPASLGFVHPTRHTPVNAVVAVTVANLIFLVLYLYTPFFGRLVLVLAAMLAWLPTMAGAVVYPYLRPDLYRRSGMADYKLFGVPLMVVAGSLGFGAVAILTVMLWNDPVAAGHSPESLCTIGAVFLLGLLWYGGARVVRRRQGIPMEQAFTQLPIE
jgi:basic amino acid/polyamine antiporter, APA family